MSSSAVVVSIPRLKSRGRVTQARVVLSEWTKFVSLRSTLWSLGVGFLLTIAFPIIFAVVTRTHRSHMSPSDRAGRHPLDSALAGVNVGQLAFAVLGVLVITGEYSTGMIRSTFIAVPKRLPVLWAKLGVFAVVAFALMLPAVIVSFFASQAILAGHHILQISFGASGVARSVVGGAIYVMLVGVFALGIGAIVRNTAGGIAAFAGILFVLPPLMNVLPTSWNDAASPYLPLIAGQAVMAVSRGAHQLAPWTGLGVLCAYTVAALAVASILLVRRDT